jgi:hypothetical protein
VLYGEQRSLVFEEDINGLQHQPSGGIRAHEDVSFLLQLIFISHSGTLVFFDKLRHQQFYADIENTSLTSSDVSKDESYPGIAESAQLPVMPSTGKHENLVLRGPAFAPLNGDPFRGLASRPDMIPPADPGGTASNLGMQHPSRQLSSMQQPGMGAQRSKSGTYGAPANQHSSQLRPLQSALGSARRMLPTATRYVKYGTKAKRPTPLVLPEPPQLPPMLSSPFTPFSSGITPAVPPKSGDYMLPFTLPLRESAPKPPPVPSKDNFN